MAKEETGLQKAAGSALPAFIKQGDTRGTENITAKDVKFPALKLAQSMSPEVKRTEPEYIDGLREGEFFNSVSRDIYGEDRLRFVVVNFLGRRNMLFDKDNRKVVIESNLPDDDPRCQFTEAVDQTTGQKKRVPPEATTFADYLVVVTAPDGPELMTLSFKKTQLGKSKTITSVLDRNRRKGLPAFAAAFTGGPIPEKRPKGTFYGWHIEPDGWADEASYALASEAYDQLKDKKVAVEDTEDDPAGADDSAVADNIPF
jgi:hypothetical protein